jgi:hypothetical protein
MKEKLFWAALLVIAGLHLDLWGWSWVEPMLVGWIPYHIGFHGLLTLLVAGCMIWLAVGIWPDPPDPYVAPDEAATREKTI